MNKACANFNRERLIEQVCKAVFWGLDQENYASPERQALVSRAIDIARQQLPIHLLFSEFAIFQRCTELFRMGASYWYRNWC